MEFQIESKNKLKISITSEMTETLKRQPMSSKFNRSLCMDDKLMPKSRSFSSTRRTSIIETNNEGRTKKSSSLLKRISTKSARKSLELEDILKNQHHLELFLKFANLEHSIENVLFFQDVLNFKENNENDLDKLAEGIDAIMDQYFKPDAIYEINTSRKFVIKMEEKRIERDFTNQFFDEVLNDVIQTNLSDTFQRFKFSELYLLINKKKRSSIFE